MLFFTCPLNGWLCDSQLNLAAHYLFTMWFGSEMKIYAVSLPPVPPQPYANWQRSVKVWDPSRFPPHCWSQCHTETPREHLVAKVPVLHRKSQTCSTEDNKSCSWKGSTTYGQCTEKFLFDGHNQLKLVATGIISSYLLIFIIHKYIYINLLVIIAMH